MVDTLFVVTVLYTAISWPLYILVTYTIFKSRSLFSSTFYTLYLISSCVDILQTFNVMMLFRVPAELSEFNPLANIYLGLPQPIVRLITFLAYHCSFMEYNLIFMISLNRFTAITFPTAHERVWRRGLPVALLFVFFEPLVATYRLIIYPTIYVYVDDESNYQIWTKNQEDAIYTVKVSQLILEAFLVLIMNAICVILILTFKTRLPKQAEMKLFIYSFSHCFVFILTAGYNSLFFFDPDQLYTAYIPYVIDLLIYSNVYLLLLLNQDIQRKVLANFPCCQMMDSMVTVEMNSKTSSMYP